MAKKNIVTINLRLNLDDPEDNYVWEHIPHGRNKKAVKLVQILYQYYKDGQDKSPTEKQLLNIIENFSKQPLQQQVVYQQQQPQQIQQQSASQEQPLSSLSSSNSKIVNGEGSINLSPLTIDNMDLDFGFIEQDIRQSNDDDKAKVYLRDVYLKSTEEFK